MGGSVRGKVTQSYDDQTKDQKQLDRYKISSVSMAIPSLHCLVWCVMQVHIARNHHDLWG